MTTPDRSKFHKVQRYKHLQLTDTNHATNLAQESKAYQLDIKKRSSIDISDNKFNLQPSDLLNFADCQYVVEISVGSRSKTFKMIVDTGSTTNLLITSKCHGGGCDQHRKYKPLNNSSKKKDFEKKLDESEISSNKISYGSGYVKYISLTDIFYIENIKIPKQKFGGVIDQETVFANAAYDG